VKYDFSRITFHASRFTFSRYNQYSIIFTEETMAKDKDSQTPSTETIAETDNYLAWRAEEPDGETTYHLELNNVTLHFFTEEWEEFLDLVKDLA
jgi:hypothetical protein